ncbi:MAG: elongation factor G [Longimicrobiales bacterium]
MASAKEYTTEQIRNVAVLGHGGAGKTSLIDALCFAAGSSKRKGSVDEGHALTLCTPEEVEHEISMQCTPAFCEVQNAKINFLDTPGYLDFTGDTVAGVRVADAGLIVVGATAGVEVGTETVWDYCKARKLPRMFCISMMDKENANFDSVYKQIKERLTDKAIPVEIPIGEGEDFRGIINLFSERAHIFKPGTSRGEYEEQDIPEELQTRFEEWETELQETLATTNEDLLEKYLDGEKISREEAIEAMALAMSRGEIFPVFCASATKSFGMQALLKKLVELCPSPAETGGEIATKPGMTEDVAVLPSDSEPFSALIFKTSNEPHVGELSFFRIFSGSIANGVEVKNAGRDAMEKLNHLAIAQGKERFEVSRLHAGDIGVVAKLKHSHTNDTLAAPSRPVTLTRIDFPNADIALAVKGATRADEDKLGEVMAKLHEEDPTFSADFNSELRQTIARGLGEMHLEIQFERMKRKYGVSVETEAPKIAYRETITKEAQGQGRFKKQSGGRGQFGDCKVRLRPLHSGEGFNFKNSIKGGVIPSKYVPSVAKGIEEAAQNGILAGYPLVDFEAECYDGSYHSVDSSDIAFKVAGSMAFKKVAPDCRPVILEPMIEVAVSTPDDFVGDIMGDITSRRGKVQGMEPTDGKTTIRAMIPEAELYKYAALLRSMTQGRAHHTRAFAGYTAVPELEAKKIIAESKKAHD